MYTSPYQSRFTSQGSRLLDERIKRDHRHITRFVLNQHKRLISQPAAILLGGSYGRGEGAVYRQDERERPWFDYDIFIIYRQLGDLFALRENYTAWESLAHTKLGVRLDLKTPGDTFTAYNLPVRLQWFDLIHGHQVLWGPNHIKPRLIENHTHLSIEDALNLMLFWGGQILLSQTEDVYPEKTQDLWYRAIIAAGDACLIAHRRYEIFENQRAQAFHIWQRDSGQTWGRALSYLYQEALQYKSVPSQLMGNSEQFKSREREFALNFVNAYLYLFQYANAELHLFSAQNMAEGFDLQQHGTIRNKAPLRAQFKALLENFKHFSGQGFRSNWYTRPPKQRLYYLLPFVLLKEERPPSDTLKWVLPNVPDTANWAALEAGFLTLWRQHAQDLI